MEEMNLKALDKDPLTHLDENALSIRHSEIEGVFWIIPNLIGIYYKLEGNGFRICLRLGAINVVCGFIDLANPCVNLEGNVICAKASIKVCLKEQGGRLCLTYEAQACYRDFPCLWSDWKCVSDRGTILCV